MIFKSTTLLIILVIIFGGFYLWLVQPLGNNFGLGHRFDWPDETANYFWSKRYAETGSLVVSEPLNLVAQNQIHPRSFNVRSDGALVPGSFLGIILLDGTLARIFGSGIIIYLTPIFSVLAILAFYGIIKRIFNERIALISSILMLFHPAWWYYSVTSMLPNVTFIAGLLFSIYFLLKNSKIKFVDVLLAGSFLGLSLSIRPSEIIWVGFIYLIILIYRRNQLGAGRIFLLLAAAVLIFLPTIYQQRLIYGDFLTSGYNQLDGVPESCQSCQLVKSIILPFGFHPTLVGINFWTHFISRFWIWTLLAVLGLVAFLVQTTKQKPEIFAYVIISMFIFAWLAIYYGSWQFADLLTVHLNTLGLSYVRYWLPLYLLSLPFIAIGLIWLTSFLKNNLNTAGLVILLVILFYQSANLVLIKKPDSILPVRQRVLSYKQTAAEVLNLTSPDSVIVTVRKDKLFFPERRVIHAFEALSLNNQLLKILPNLVNQTPVYYYALGPEPTTEIDNLRLVEIKKFGQEIFYQIYLK